MSSINADQLTELVSTALERTAFVLVDPADEDAEASFTPARRSSLQLNGSDWTGVITLTADEGFLCELASSLLGVDEDEVELEEQGQDVILELANILAGSVSLLLGGDKTHIGLGLPELQDTTTPTPDADASTMLEGESGFLKVQWSVAASSKAAA